MTYGKYLGQSLLLFYNKILFNNPLIVLIVRSLIPKTLLFFIIWFS